MILLALSVPNNFSTTSYSKDSKIEMILIMIIDTANQVC